MSGPSKNGVLIYAKQLKSMSSFYERLLGARIQHADEAHIVLQLTEGQLIIHSILPEIAQSIVISSPPTPRQEQAIKPFFTVESLAMATQFAQENGGIVCGPIWPGPGIRVQNIADPEGNIIHLREHTT